LKDHYGQGGGGFGYAGIVKNKRTD
jgi:hypothetical protein